MQRLAQGPDGDEDTDPARSRAVRRSQQLCPARSYGGMLTRRRGQRRAADAHSQELTIVGAYVTGAQPVGQLKTLDGLLGLIAEHAHGGAA
ncbi:hypothetical protein NDU88_005936 [Pleurodeles waltl]|uniref:Uncharacterized protein n=1 Tax=Pleurodeles waltl TaxID=8319 RepID=A0AAV7X023_PLEWA|nr:hypothetical protein NDU88_005936 [Pleurodeles waltl]